MRSSMRFPSFRTRRRTVASACARSAECQRQRDNDAARDHLSRRGSDQASAVARRTYASWR
jgi:hypothetical protein